VTDRETARLFGTMVEQEPAIMASLPPPRREVVQAEIASAFRVAFLAIAGFSAIGLALSIPVRRI